MVDDSGERNVKSAKTKFPITDQVKKRLEDRKRSKAKYNRQKARELKYSDLSDGLKIGLERVTGIQVDSDQSLREAADLIANRETDPEVLQRVRDIEARAHRKLRERAPHCSICGRTQREVSQLFGGQNNHICDKCIEART